jgi:hypothetical protein
MFISHRLSFRLFVTLLEIPVLCKLVSLFNCLEDQLLPCTVFMILVEEFCNDGDVEGMELLMVGKIISHFPVMPDQSWKISSRWPVKQKELGNSCK